MEAGVWGGPGGLAKQQCGRKGPMRMGHGVCSGGAWGQDAGQLAELGRVPWRLLVLLLVVAALSLDGNYRLCCQFSWALPSVQAAARSHRLKHWS